LLKKKVQGAFGHLAKVDRNVASGRDLEGDATTAGCFQGAIGRLWHQSKLFFAPGKAVELHCCWDGALGREWAKCHLCDIFLARHPICTTSVCATFHLRDLPVARHPICATTYSRDFSTARHPICVTSRMRDFSIARYPICATTYLRDFFYPRVWAPFSSVWVKLGQPIFG